MAQPPFDVVIVGSGASGGWAAKRLTEAGLRVAVLEAGRQLTNADYREHVQAFELKYRAKTKRPLARERPVQSISYAVREWNSSWFVNDIDEPYVDESDPKFFWVRPRLVGGRTNVWGRESLRISDLEFKAASHDGHGVDWPIGYKDVEPYYDLVEEYIGVQGMTEGLPGLPDGKFQPPMAMTCAETALRNRIKKAFGRTLTQGRTANLTKPTHGRQPCHFCGPCEHGCVTHSYFNASYTTMADAIATGRCTLITGAMVYKVLVDPDTRRARGVLYIDRTTRQPREISGRVVALCAQTQESTRILLNSATQQDPNGLANSSGLVGRGLMTHFSDSGATADLPEFSEEGDRGRAAPSLLADDGELPKPAGRAPGEGFPARLRVRRLRRHRPEPRRARLRPGVQERSDGAPAGERLDVGLWRVPAAEDNYVTVDPGTVDAYGIPVPKIHLTPRENEKAMLADMADTAAEMLEAAGAENIQQIHVARGNAHELGTARMGTDPKTSVLTPFQQTHDIRNLFVMDGSGFASSVWQNPTLTIMALAVRSCEFLKEQLKQGEL